jgi:hypothetical protein
MTEMENPIYGLLKNRATPDTKHEFKIQLVGSRPLSKKRVLEEQYGKEEDEGEEDEGEEDEGEERQDKIIRPKVVFTDNRGEMNKDNYDIIINRLKPNLLVKFTTTMEKQIQEPILPPKKGILFKPLEEEEQEQEKEIVGPTIIEVIEDTPQIPKKKRILKIKPKKKEEGEDKKEEGDEKGEPIEIGGPIAPAPLVINKRRYTIKKRIGEKEGKETNIVLNDAEIKKRLPVKDKQVVIMKAPTYYMNNRKKFIQKLMELFYPYRQEFANMKESFSCSSGETEEFNLLLHQKIVRDYLNIYTPYRGLLLYHGLGSGKTCTSIAIAEGMKENKKVFLMTPASLKMNYFDQLKKCGDTLYKRNQYWEFVSITGNPNYVGILSRALSLKTEFIERNGGAWLVHVKNPPNYSTLSTTDRSNVDAQLDEMIRSKYIDINYNANNLTRILKGLSDDFKTNPFDNNIVIIDEAHNISRGIVNKIKDKKYKSTTYILYDMLMKAENVRIVFLTGTPIVNYPNEIAVLYNILRGYIYSWTFDLKVLTGAKVDTAMFIKLFNNGGINTYDYIDYSGGKLTITRNPYGFVNTNNRGIIGKQTQSQPKTIIQKKVVKGGATKKLGQEKKTKNGKNKTKKQKQKQGKGEPFAEKIIVEGQDEGKDEEIIEYGLKVAEAEREVLRGGANVDTNYNGIKLNDSGNISNTDFISAVEIIIRGSGIFEISSKKETKYTSLPDDSTAFFTTFVDTDSNTTKNLPVLKRRIFGLTSYFRSAQEQLLPRIVENEKGGKYHIVKCEMSSHQFSVYAEIRKMEMDKEKKAKTAARMKKGEDNVFEIPSSYRTYSRVSCNFAFPSDIPRPFPKQEKKEAENEDEDNAISGGAEEADSGEDSSSESGTEIDDSSSDESEKVAQIAQDDTKDTEEEVEEKEEEVEEKEEEVGDKIEEEVGDKIEEEVEEKEEEVEEKEEEVEEKEGEVGDKTEGEVGDKTEGEVGDKTEGEQGEDEGVNPDAEEEKENELESIIVDNEEYAVRIEKAMNLINTPEYLSRENLPKLSTKFSNVLENVLDEDNKGLHLIYSNYRTLEGIGILRLILLQNGYVEFKLKRIGGVWDFEIKAEDIGKPRFVLYTGTETTEEKEIIRNIYNSNWSSGTVPQNIISKFQKEGAENNFFGEVIQILMITASGAEGIDLKNTRFVHIIEAYWNMVRVEQVVGRARRICSHQSLPEKYRTLKVFFYISSFSEEQKKSPDYKELMIHDTSRVLPGSPPITTDESLFEISSIKEDINNEILHAIKETAIDCDIYSANTKNKKGTDKGENLVCYGSQFGQVETNEFSSYPALLQDQGFKDEVGVKMKQIAAVELTVAGIKYAYDEKTKNVYDFESYMEGRPLLIGVLKGNKIVKT